MTTITAFADLAAQAEHIARLARSLADAEAARSAEVVGFHKNSAARRAALVLLDSRGQWLTRSEISEASGCRPNAVVAVVQRLRGNGLLVERRTVSGKAEYRIDPGEES